MMSRIFLTGDTHGGCDITAPLSRKNFPEQRNLTKDDYLIILGDFGVIWNEHIEHLRNEAHWMDYFETRNYTTIVVLGNHENYERIFKLPEVEMFGNTVWEYVAGHVYILQRGRVYEIAGKKFFTMGGAVSIDKANRRVNYSWWEAEIPSTEEFDRGLQELEDHNYEVDYVLTHTLPRRVITWYMNACRDSYIDEFKVGGKLSEDFYKRIEDTFIDKDMFDAKKCAVSDYLDLICFENGLSFNKWFAGHFHDNWLSKDGKFQIYYRTVNELEL